MNGRDGADPELLHDLLSALCSTGADWAEVFLQESRGAHVEALAEGGADAREGLVSGAGLTLELDGRTCFRSVDGLSPEALLREARALAQSIGGGAAAPVAPLARRPAREICPALRPPAATSLSEKEALVRDTLEAAARAPGFRSGSVLLKDVSSVVAVANSDGVFTQEDQHSVTLYAQVTLAEGERSAAGSRVISAAGGVEHLGEEARRRLALDAAEAARFALAAGPVPEGELPVVLSPFAAGQVLHEALGHLLEADSLIRGLSPLGGPGEGLVAAPCLNLEDDGSLPGLRGSADYDDEGWPTGPVTLMSEGRVTGLLTDRASAARLGLPRTGHARRESYRSPASCRMRNLTLRPGERAQEELMRGIPFGIHAVRVGAGRSDLEAGTFAFLLTEGYLIREGRPSEAVGGAVLEGRFWDVLLGIQEAASEVERHPGVCARDGQGVGVSDGSPAIRLAKILVRRRAQ